MALRTDESLLNESLLVGNRLSTAKMRFLPLAVRSKSWDESQHSKFNRDGRNDGRSSQSQLRRL